MINFRSAGNLRGLSEDAKYLWQVFRKKLRDNTGVLLTVVFYEANFHGNHRVSGGGLPRKHFPGSTAMTRYQWFG